MSVFRAIFLLTLLAVLSNSQTVVNECKEGGMVPSVLLKSVDTPCKSSPCIVYTGYSADININFTSPSYSEKLIPSINVAALGAHINWDLKQPNACAGITNTMCPIVKDEPICYTYAMKLSEWFPEVLVNIEFSLTNAEDNKLVSCFSVDLQVKKK